MEAKELRSFNVEELKSRVSQWRDELFRAKFKAQSSEAKDTSVFKKLRRDIARGETILREKVTAMAGTTLTEVKAPAAAPQDKPVKAEASAPTEKKSAAKKAAKPAAKKAKAKE